MAATNLSISVTLADKVSQPARQVNAAIDGMNKRMKSATLGTNGFGAAVDKNTRLTKKFAMSGLQQAGYQVGDFAVQVGAGTSALQAFGQQGSQFFGIFGPVGALFGAGIAIVAALGNAYQKSSGQAKTFREETDKLNQSFDTAIKFLVPASERLETLTEKYGDASKGAQKLFDIQARLAQLELGQQITKTVTALEAELGSLNSIRRAQEKLQGAEGQRARQLQRNINNQIRAFKEQFKELGLGDEQVKALTASFTKLSEIDILKDPLEAARLLQGLLAELEQAGFANVSQASLATLQQLGQLIEKLRQYGNAAQEANEAATNSFGLTQDASDKLSQSVAQAFGDSFKSIITGTESVKDAFKNMARNIIDQLIEVLIIQRLVGTVGGNGQAGTGLAGLFSDTLARGGPITTGQSYLVGEKGPEIITAGANARVIPNNQIGGGTTVVQNINISTGVSQTVRAEIQQMLPQIAEASKSAVLDARRRGGSFAAAF